MDLSRMIESRHTESDNYTVRLQIGDVLSLEQGNPRRMGKGKSDGSLLRRTSHLRVIRIIVSGEDIDNCVVEDARER